MSAVLFWFRNDLRLHDQPALQAALTGGATHLLPVVCLPAADESTPWGCARVGLHRRAFTAAALRGLGARMAALGNPLIICNALPSSAGQCATVAQTAPSLAGQDPRSSFPYGTPACDGSEAAALAHLAQYLGRKLPHSYKATRNGLMGRDYSSKFSPWLATGALSPRQIYADLKAFERDHGANDGTYWLGFELLWRDYFRLLHLQYGAALYRARGLSELPLAPHNPRGFERWCRGDTGQPLVDAAMRELAATGYLSNRLRQVVASFLIYDLRGDWRAGAAWFESQLVDYDVYSNQANWLYIAGRGTDPRGGRRFDPIKQTQDHDADGSYRRLWGTL